MISVLGSDRYHVHSTEIISSRAEDCGTVHRCGLVHCVYMVYSWQVVVGAMMAPADRARRNLRRTLTWNRRSVFFELFGEISLTNELLRVKSRLVHFSLLGRTDIELIIAFHFVPSSYCTRFSSIDSIWRAMMIVWRLRGNIIGTALYCLQCFDSVGWVAGMASGL